MAARRLFLLFATACLLVLGTKAHYSHSKLRPKVHGAGLQEGDSTPELDLQVYSGKTVMMISAHPDDIEAMAGGLITRLTAQSTKVVYVIVTNGDKGCQDSQYYNCSSLSSVDIASIRQKEARAAAALLGVTDVVLLDLEDGMVTSYPEQSIREQLTAAVRRYKPVAVFTWHPYPQFDLQPGNGWADLGFHPDHQAVGRIAIDTALGPSAGSRLLFPELLLAGLQPHGVSHVLLWTCEGFSHYVDISSELPRKVAALVVQRSQFPDAEATQTTIATLGSTLAQLAGVSAKAPYVETFFQICIFANCSIH